MPPVLQFHQVSNNLLLELLEREDSIRKEMVCLVENEEKAASVISELKEHIQLQQGTLHQLEKQHKNSILSNETKQALAENRKANIRSQKLRFSNLEQELRTADSRFRTDLRTVERELGERDT
jgi:hypothetical protein